jgi:hypothetical protein
MSQLTGLKTVPDDEKARPPKRAGIEDIKPGQPTEGGHDLWVVIQKEVGGARRSQFTVPRSTNRVAAAVRDNSLPPTKPIADIRANAHRLRPRTRNSRHLVSP